MRRETIICDVCGKQKQETNHWFSVVTLNSGLMHAVAVTAQNEAKALQSFFMDTLAEIFDCCGELCALKKVSELIAGGKSATPAPEKPV